MRHCRERQTQAKHLPETTPGQRQFKQARQAFLDRQQALLEQQAENHRRAVVAAAATYDQYKSAAVGNLMRAIRRSGRNEEKVKQLHARMLALLKDPATDPNLQIFDSRKRKYVSPLFAEFDYANEHERRRVELTEVLIRRHIRLPESLPVFYPGQGVTLIRYGVGRVDFINPDRPKFYAENAFSPDSLLAGVFGESESLPPVPIKKHRIVSRFSVLHYAVLKNDMARFRFALEAVSTPSVTDSDGQTALHWAVKYGHSDFIAPLLAAGCDPAVRDRKGRLYTDCVDMREIHLLSRKDRFDVPGIIQRAENVNILLENGRTPLQHFVDDAAICRLLLEKGADPRLLGPDDLLEPILYDFSKRAEMFLPVAPGILCAVPTHSLQMTLQRSRLVKQSSLRAAIRTAFDRISPEDRDDLMRRVLQDVRAEKSLYRPAPRSPKPEKLSWTDRVLVWLDERMTAICSSVFDSLRGLVGKEK